MRAYLVRPAVCPLLDRTHEGRPGVALLALRSACCGHFVHVVVTSGIFVVTWCHVVRRVVAVVGHFVGRCDVALSGGGCVVVVTCGDGHVSVAAVPVVVLV